MASQKIQFFEFVKLNSRENTMRMLNSNVLEVPVDHNHWKVLDSEKSLALVDCSCLAVWRVALGEYECTRLPQIKLAKSLSYRMLSFF